jgi:hypothetical protein
VPSLPLPAFGFWLEDIGYFRSRGCSDHFDHSPVLGGVQDCPSRGQPHVRSHVNDGGVVLVLVDALVAGVLVAISVVGGDGESGRLGGGCFFFLVGPSRGPF